MWRASLKIAACLVLGVVTSVAVAWGCAIASTFGRWSETYRQKYSDYQQEYADEVCLLRHERLRGGGLSPSESSRHFGVRGMSAFYAEAGEDGGDEWTLVPAVEGDWDSIYWSLAGWPCYALSSHGYQFRTAWTMGMPPPKVRSLGLVIPASVIGNWPDSDFGLPIRPVWPGMAVNVVVYSALFGAIGPARRVAVRVYRQRFDRCIACGYCLAGNTSGVCPECGKPVAPRTGAGM